MSVTEMILYIVMTICGTCLVGWFFWLMTRD